MLQMKLCLRIFILCLFLNQVYTQTVQGTIFRDLNWNGIKDPSETGISGIQINIALKSGVIPNPPVTDANGYFSVNIAAFQTFEFSINPATIPSYLVESYTTSGSTRSWLIYGSSPANFSLAFASLDDYCSDNVSSVPFAVNCYVYGNQVLAGTSDVLVTFPFSAGVNVASGMAVTTNSSSAPLPRHVATAPQIGTTWGLAYQKKSKRLYASAFQKRHSGFVGNVNSNTGAIFSIDFKTTPPTTSIAYDLDINSNPTRAALDAHDLNNYLLDDIAWNKVGKYGIGGLAFDESGTFLFVMNLYLQQLVQLRVNDNGIVSFVRSSNIPSPAGCPSADVRPFAVAYKDGQVYVGVVCSAESSQNRTNLRGFVYRASLPALNFGSPALEFPFTYPRGMVAPQGQNLACSIGARPNVPANYSSANWQPWIGVKSEFPLDAGLCFFPQPMITSITFGTSINQMVIGITDRYGHQSGNVKTSPPSGQVSGVAAGDILCAYLNDQTKIYAIENNGICGPLVGGVTWNPTFFSANRTGNGNNEGPGGGEFFVDDNYPGSHAEVTLGGLASLPGTGLVLSTAFDPLPTAGAPLRSAGIRYYSMADGHASQFYIVFQTDAGNETFGKAAGLGDIEPMCNMPPLQIGNRVWFDTDGDGVQDVGEVGIQNLTLYLYQGQQLITTTKTDQNGEYYLSSRDGLLPNTQYTLVIMRVDADNSFSCINCTFASPIMNINDNERDSNLLVDPISTNYYATITTGTFGDVDFTWDLGIGQLVPLGTLVWLDRNSNSRNETGLVNGEIPLPGVTVLLVGENINGPVLESQVTNSTGQYLFFVRPNQIYNVIVQYSPQNNPIIGSLVPSVTQFDSLGTSGTSQGINSVFVTITTTNFPNFRANFGFRPTANVGDYVWYDRYLNGIQDTNETGIPGVLVTLEDQLEGSSTTFTDNTGHYMFYNITPNNAYIMSIQLSDPALAGRRPTLSSQGGNVELDSNGVLNQGASTASVTVIADSDLSIDFGFRDPLTLGDLVWSDENFNGRQDTGEPGIPSVTVILVPDNPNFPNVTTITDSNGIYLFPDVFPNSLYRVVIPLNTNNLAALDNRVPTLYFASDPTLDSNGIISLDNSSVQATQLVGTVSDINVDFGFRRVISVGDYVWMDTNSNGVQDSTESGFSFITLTLEQYDSSGNLVKLTNNVTDSNGFYIFNDVDYFTNYRVVINLDNLANPGLSDFMPTYLTGTNPATNSNGQQQGNLVVASFAIGSQSDFTIDFGFRPRLYIGDFVWKDLDSDGVQGTASTDPPLPGVVVMLYDQSGTTFIRQTTTNANGNYRFEVDPNSNFMIRIALSDSALTGFKPTYSLNTPNTSIDSNGVIAANFVQSTVSVAMSSELTIDFGFRPFIYIGDYVWSDENGNGLQDINEPGLGGVTVRLEDTIPQQTVTNQTGYYLFEVEPNTFHTVVINLVNGALNGRPPTISVSSPGNLNSDGTATGNRYVATAQVGSTSNLDVDFGFLPILSIGNFVWNDSNLDGIQQSTEEGIPNLPVYLYDSSFTNVIATTVTNVGGIYNFDVQPFGQYIVAIMTNATQLQDFSLTPSFRGDNTLDSNGVVNGNFYTATVTVSTTSDFGIDFGFIPKIYASGIVWNDQNQDGVKDVAEPLLPNVVVQLRTPDGQTVISTTTTNTVGFYRFSIQPFTSYVVYLDPNQPAVPANSLPTVPGIDSVGTLTGSVIIASFTSQTSPVNNINFGLIQPIYVGDLVWIDSNADGIYQSNEPGIADITLVLTDTNNVFLNSTTTNSAGMYQFFVNPNSGYIISILTNTNAFSGLEATQTGRGTTINDSNGVQNGNVVSAQFSVGLNNDLSIDFGFRPILSIGNYVWCDQNLDGVQSTGEPGIGNITLQLWSNSVLANTTTTDSQGFYSFYANPYTDYIVRIPLVSGRLLGTKLPTDPNQGTSDLDSNGVLSQDLSYVQSTVSIYNVGDQTIDFGFRPPLHVGDTVWVDLNSNGAQDAGEPGIAGVTIQLLRLNAVIAQTTTDNNGKYQFEVSPGMNYRLTIDLTSTVLQNFRPTTFSAAGVSADRNSDGVVSGTIVSATVQIMTQSNDDIDFGFEYTVGVGDFVWCDLNNDGQQGGELGVSNVTVTLIDLATQNQTTTSTNSNGYYQFNGLGVNSQYRVAIILDSSNLASLGECRAPTTANIGNNQTDSNGILSTVNQVGAIIADIQTTSLSDNSVDFGFQLVPVGCNLSTYLYHYSKIVCENQEDHKCKHKKWKEGTHWNNKWNKEKEHDDKPKEHEENWDKIKEKEGELCEGTPVHVRVYPAVSGTCITLEPLRGGFLGQFDYFAISSPKLSQANVVSATSYGVDISSKLRVQTYHNGSLACTGGMEASLCSTFSTLTNTPHPLSEGDMVFCTTCSELEYVRAPIEVCFAGLSTFDFAMTTIKVKARNVGGWCDDSVSAYGVLTARCDVNKACLAGDVVCEKQCNGNLPITMNAWSPIANTVCLEIRPTDNVTIGNIEYITFSGRNIPIINSTVVKAVDGDGNILNDRVPLETYSGGLACSSHPACQGFCVNEGKHVEVRTGDVNVCLGCNMRGKASAPLQVCFTKPGLQLSNFENSIVKIHAKEVCGFCDMHELGSSVVLQRTSSNCTELIALSMDEYKSDAAGYYLNNRTTCSCHDEVKQPEKHKEKPEKEKPRKEIVREEVNEDCLEELNKFLVQKVKDYLSKKNIESVNDCTEELESDLLEYVMNLAKNYIKKNNLVQQIKRSGITESIMTKNISLLIKLTIKQYIKELKMEEIVQYLMKNIESSIDLKNNDDDGEWSWPQVRGDNDDTYEEEDEDDDDEESPSWAPVGRRHRDLFSVKGKAKRGINSNDNMMKTFDSLFNSKIDRIEEEMLELIQKYLKNELKESLREHMKNLLESSSLDGWDKNQLTNYMKDYAKLFLSEKNLKNLISQQKLTQSFKNKVTADFKSRMSQLSSPGKDELISLMKNCIKRAYQNLKTWLQSELDDDFLRTWKNKVKQHMKESSKYTSESVWDSLYSELSTSTRDDDSWSHSKSSSWDDFLNGDDDTWSHGSHKDDTWDDLNPSKNTWNDDKWNDFHPSKDTWNDDKWSHGSHNDQSNSHWNNDDDDECDCECEVCNHTLTRPTCPGLKGYIVCQTDGNDHNDAHCNSQPIEVLTTTQSNTVCLHIWPTQGVSVGKLDFISFSGIHTPINESARISTAISGSCDISNEIAMQTYMGGRVCKSDDCLGYQIGSNINNGDLNVCLGCECSEDNANDWDNLISDDVALPAMICFNQTNVVEQDFLNAVIKIKLRDVTGYCNRRDVTAVAVMLNNTEQC